MLESLDLAAQMDLRPECCVLDVGCGIGGPARYFAAEHGCKVTGIDLTEEFVQVAKSLTGRLKLDHLVEFRQASALALPFGPSTFDRAYMIHVGMNIADKPPSSAKCTASSSPGDSSPSSTSCVPPMVPSAFPSPGP